MPKVEINGIVYDICRAPDIGKKGYAKQVRSTCPICKKQSWVEVKRIDEIKQFANRHCSKCNPRFRGTGNGGW